MVSCKEKGKQETKQSFELKKTEKRSVEDLIVFENLLMTDDIKTAEYKNINFDQNGALFSKNMQAHIREAVLDRLIGYVTNDYHVITHHRC